MSNKATDYKRKFNEEKYDRLYITVNKGEKEVLESHSKTRDGSLNKFVNRAILETLERDKAGAGQDIDL